MLVTIEEALKLSKLPGTKVIWRPNGGLEDDEALVYQN
jgi:hypothetical protein